MNQSRTSQESKLKRLSLWTSQWLDALLFCIPLIAKAPLPKCAHDWVERQLSLCAMLVTRIVLIRAANLPRAASLRDRFCVRRARARHDVRERAFSNQRALIGGALRRALQSRGSLNQRAEKILRALRRQDQLLARFVRRMRKGLSRRISAFTRVEPLHHSAALNGPPPLAARGEELRAADTS